MFRAQSLRWSAGEDSSGKFQVLDLSGTSSTISSKLTMPGNDSNVPVGIWGDWVAFATYSDPGGATVRIHNYRTGAEKALPGYGMVALGDGFAVVRSGAGASSVWNFVTGVTTALAGSPDLSRENEAGYSADLVAVDGNRVAFTDSSAGKLHVQTFAGLARSAPRSLGVVASGSSFTPGGQSWSVSIDVTKPLAAGQLQVLNPSGSVVRSIKVPATATGSLRGIVWDGKDDAGHLVAGGTYGFKLTSQATDGTGTVMAVDGTQRSLGSVRVIGPSLVAATPVIRGTAVVDGSLAVTPGAWAPAGLVEFTYQWLRDGRPIAGATGTGYRATAADAGHNIAIQITGRCAGAVQSRTSAAVRVVTAMFSAAPQPTASGTWYYGNTVSASAKGWSPTPGAVSYQWLRDGQPISGATGASYTLGADDVGRLVSLRVTGTKAGYGTVQTFSAAHSVGGKKFSKAGGAKLSGTAKVGKSLKVKLGKFSPKPARITYQWLRNGQLIGGATKSKYKLVKADKRQKVSVRVTATKPGYYPVVKASSAKKIK